jgi:hypothetical protein
MGNGQEGQPGGGSFDPCTSKAQRDALAPIILKTYGLEWGDLKVQEAPIEIRQSGDIVEAKLADGQRAYMKLQREPGVDGRRCAQEREVL